VNYRTLGRTGLRVSAISFGAVEIGLPYGIPIGGKVEKPTEKEAHDLLHAALDMGINFVDTARGYADSEAIIGRALKGRRNEYILATKTFCYADQGLTTQEQLTRIRDSIDTSLRILQTDVIDVLQAHNMTKEVLQRGDVVRALEGARQAGKARYLGATVYGVDDPLAVVRNGRLDLIQVAYNMLDRRLEAEVLPLAAQKEIAVTVRSALLKGALTPRYQHLPDSLAALKGCVQTLEQMVADEAASLPEAAFRYVLANPAVSSALVGTGKLANLQRAVESAAGGPLSDQLMDAIRSLQVADPSLLNPSTWGIKENYGDRR
jgi:1-deoxyxylulose-5-phosphate synthase